MIVSSPDGSNISVWSRTVPVYFVKSIELNETYLFLEPDGTKRLTATVLPEDADNKEVTWESSDETVAQIINDGLVLAVAEGTCTITCNATDGSGIKAECKVRVGDAEGVTDGHEWVDLGLPSGTLWATCNVGANSPEKYGGYYAWGETTTKTDYGWSTYKYSKGSNTTMTKYCTDSKYGYNGFTDNMTELLPEDDAATANWGSNWQMPSRAQSEELINSDYTTTEWTTMNGKKGRKITSKSNSKSIFLPAASRYFGKSLDATTDFGRYWLRSLLTNPSSGAVQLAFNIDDITTGGNDSRSYGQSVRPVRKQ